MRYNSVPSAIARLVATGAVACLGVDLVHEAGGHLIVARLLGVETYSLSTVALQTGEVSRLVAAAGTAANVLTGILALATLQRLHRQLTTGLLLWLLAAFSLFNVGYLAVSAVLDTGDWAVVIEGLTPRWCWRLVIGIVGIAGYWLALKCLAASLATITRRHEIGHSELKRFLLASYLGGGIALTAAAVFNPITPALILMSGIGGSFGLNFGLLLLPAMVENITPDLPRVGTTALKAASGWLWLMFPIAVALIAIFGPGVKLSR